MSVLRNESTQQILLGKADLNLSKTMDIAQRREAAECNALIKNPEMVIQKVVSFTKGAETRTLCYCCGRPDHNAKDSGFACLNAITSAS